MRAQLAEVRRRRGDGQSRQRDAQGFGLPAKTPEPELAALIGHRCGGPLQRLPFEQPRHKKQSDQHDAESQIRQREIRQQRHRAPAAFAQVAPHAGQAVETDVFQRAAIESVGGQRTLSLALRAMAWPVAFGIGEFCIVLLDGAEEWV